MPSLQIKSTRDGSATLYVPHLHEHYHSIHGAVTESLHVFIEAGLHHMAAKSLAEIRILEIGFGTGLNAWLTALASTTLPHPIVYSAIELHPLPEAILQPINYPQQHAHEEGPATWSAIHECPWQQPVSVLPSFTLLKWAGDWLHETPPSEATYSLIYYDAFAPEKQPQMWSHYLFTKCYQLLSPGGVLVTYTSKGDVRRGLQAAGFMVDKIPGPPGKREMLRATKPIL